MNPTDSARIINELTLRVLRGSGPEGKGITISSVALLDVLRTVLQFTASEKLKEQIGQLMHFKDDDKKKTGEENVKILSDLIDSVIHGDSEFMTISLESGVLFPSQMDLKGIPTTNNAKFCKDENSIKKMNAEIDRLTENKITNFLNEHNRPKSGVTLFNVMHLKAEFCNIFRPDSTEVGDFHISASKTIKIPLMKTGGMMMYNDDKEIGARVMHQNFNGCSFSISVIVPEKKFGLKDMEQKLTADKYNGMLTNMRPVLGSLSIPKCAVNYVTDLNLLLGRSGLKDLFDPASAKLFNHDIAVDHFVHAICMNINEFGSNVPERTLRDHELYGMCCGGFLTPPENQDIIANEPFLLVIHYHKQNSIVSISRIVDPVEYK